MTDAATSFNFLRIYLLMFSKNMKSTILIGLFLALTFAKVQAERSENEVARGLYPFMAFIYYPDETVVDSTGNRFIRGAILIRINWLVSSAIDPDILNGFPRKTLLARAGAITIDANFTLNEDEYEQEREVIQIVRPYNYSATQWWRTDISLMKTLLPFNLSSAVGISTMNPKLENMEKNCIILVYVRRFGNWTEDKILMQMYVDLLPPSITNCGNHYVGNTMICAADNEEKRTNNGPNFCHGNSGGPLICEGEVVGLQTYIDNNCKQPHLYQLLKAWDNFVSCGTEDNCQDEQCANICDIVNKDASAPMVVTSTEEIEISSTEIVTTTLTTSTTQNNSNFTEFTKYISTILTTDDKSDTIITTVTPQLLKLETELISKIMVDVTTDIPNKTTDSTIKTTTPNMTLESEVGSSDNPSWPEEKQENKKLENGEQETIERKPAVEAQHQNVKVTSAAHNIVVSFYNLLFGLFITTYLIFQ